MLDESIKKVNSIVENTKTKVDRLITNGKEKIETGTSTAEECQTALDEILDNVQKVKLCCC